MVTKLRVLFSILTLVSTFSSRAYAHRTDELCTALLGMRSLELRDEVTFQIQREDVFEYWKNSVFKPLVTRLKNDGITDFALVQRLPRNAPPAQLHHKGVVIENDWRLADPIEALCYTRRLHEYCATQNIVCDLWFMTFEYRDAVNVGGYTLHRYDFYKDEWDEPISLPGESNARPPHQQVALVKLCLTLPKNQAHNISR